ncbi:DUF2760 domain-containing protein [Catenovulum sp. 2E275]|uniref:DUF2760 domain-containing protein n=1 Tax=Catenovulum sp. 2E275 TaxID=2980497 RepID=UPI0021CED8A1|nr:DUF2760 domain-containing protein [Catenovulum sp. 2E275]MCU4677182.1 DUF2760 domain-containing protein [Catenovulum sp. 2E275]
MRLTSAFSYFFKILFQGEAKALAGVAKTQAEPSANNEQAAQNRPKFQHSQLPAVQVLNLFQANGRLIDFLKEDITPYSDADIGAAVRDIHAGCRKVLDKHFDVQPIIAKNEGDSVAVEAHFDPSKIELVGNLTSQNASETGAQGLLVHKGWYAANTHLPTIADGQDQTVIAAAQVEVKA